MRILLISWVFFMPMCSILLGVEIGFVSGQCLGDQKALLLQLKEGLRFNANKTPPVQWDQNSDCCSWDGVSCDEVGRVTVLNLSNKSISGGLDNSSLFNLEHLKRLDLSLNNFNNSLVPARIGGLTSLTYLNLSNAGFAGQIPRELSKLTGLVVLDISTFSLLQTSRLKLENPNLGALVQNLSELEELYLDGVNISARGREWCQALSSSLPNLRELSLSNCYISGPIDLSLERLRSLSVIRLDNNNLSSQVPGFFSSFSNLTSLHLGSCRLYGTFPKEIFQVPTLQIIDISVNPSLQGSLPEFPRNSYLQRLLLSSTTFSGSLPASIGNLSNLSTLQLSGCQFDGVLPSSMAELSQLVSLDLSINKFIGPLPNFTMSKNLTKVVLSHNSFTGAITSAHWEGHNKLLVLDLRNNSLNGSIPASLFTLQSLERIWLSNNQFEDHLPQFLNVSSSELDTLDLSSNKLEGPIPKFIFQYPKLSILSLSYNKLSGSIKLDSSQGLCNLTTLDLSYNSLAVIATSNDSIWPYFPKLSTLKLASCRLTAFPNLRNQSKLVNLDLSDNNINGEIPNWIWELGNKSLQQLNLSYNYLVGMQEPYSIPTSLSVLDLRHNQLRGKFPNLPQSAIYIDLSSNNFTSSIPPDIGNYLSYTLYFSLSNNNLRGGIPKSICSASYLQVLDLSHNKLSNRIPKCVLAMSQILGVLNLRRNNFSGPIPDSLSVDCALETLDLNRNMMEGHIPKSLAHCTRLEVLDLGNNKLTGTFPCLLKNISTLRVLVMRSNRFKGNIGCPNTTGVWSMLQIVDLAHNNFNGSFWGHCLTKWKAMMNDDNDAQQKLRHLQFEFLEFSQSRYYRDTVTVTFKGLELKLQKILTVFTSIDLSCNNFVGPIPQEVGQLRALYILNVSHNALTGEIPSSIGNLRQLESLDLSSNSLSGEIPASLASLNFLSFLNLSFNHLAGQIPSGNQIQTFSADSFAGNEGLCGFPLKKSCSSPPEAEPRILSNVEFDWQSIYGGIGFGVGAGVVVALLMLWREGKYWLEDSIDNAFLVMLPMLGYSYRPRDEWYDDEESYFEEDHNETATEDGDSQGQYCVFCSKLDISRKRVIHDLSCTCHSSPAMSPSTFSSSSSSSLQ